MSKRNKKRSVVKRKRRKNREKERANNAKFKDKKAK